MPLSQCARRICAKSGAVTRWSLPPLCLTGRVAQPDTRALKTSAIIIGVRGSLLDMLTCACNRAARRRTHGASSLGSTQISENQYRCVRDKQRESENRSATVSSITAIWSRSAGNSELQHTELWQPLHAPQEPEPASRRRHPSLGLDELRFVRSSICQSCNRRNCQIFDRR